MGVRIPPSTLTRTWTIEQFIEAVAKSRSVSQVLKSLNLCATGSNYLTIKRHTQKLGLSTTHWTGITSNRGPNHKGGWDRIPANKVLVLDRQKGLKEKVGILRRALLQSGILEVCVECGQGSTWNSKPLRLQIDHKNGNPLDNRFGNPRFLCPNCHTQTDTFGSANIKRPSKLPKPPRKFKPYEQPICICGQPISKKGRKCKACVHAAQQVIKWPSNLAELVKKSSMCNVAKQLGVSDKSVANRLRRAL
jgi:hypothetical protein